MRSAAAMETVMERMWTHAYEDACFSTQPPHRRARVVSPLPTSFTIITVFFKNQIV